MRLAIVTAYFNEDRATIERCIASVRAQTVPVEHILVADGRPQDWIPGAGVRHIVLDRAHGDFGDTPRMIGLVLAIREEFDAIQFLDADNYVLPQHAAVAEALLNESGAHMLVLKRRLLRPDGSDLNFTIDEDEALQLIDTNCYLFTRPAFPTALKWALIPRALSFIGDRVFRSVFSKVGHPIARRGRTYRRLPVPVGGRLSRGGRRATAGVPRPHRIPREGRSVVVGTG
jgi:glycosyltransferase involved in cell wall biosynthesis